MGVKLALLHISGADISSDQLWIPPYHRCYRGLRQAMPCENRATGQAQSRVGREDQSKILGEEKKMDSVRGKVIGEDAEYNA